LPSSGLLPIRNNRRRPQRFLSSKIRNDRAHYRAIAHSNFHRSTSLLRQLTRQTNFAGGPSCLIHGWSELRLRLQLESCAEKTITFQTSHSSSHFLTILRLQTCGSTILSGMEPTLT